MDSFRVILILLGIAVIIGLVAHGLWTLRSNQQRAQGKVDKHQGANKRQKGAQADLLSGADDPHADEREAPDSFDELGLSKVRLKKKSAAAPEQPEGESQVQTISNQNLHEVDGADAPVRAKALDDEPELPSLRADRGSVENSKPSDVPAQPMRAERESGEAESAAMTANQDPREVEQLAIGLPEDHLEDVSEEPPKEEVITLYVSGDIQGPLLLQTVTELGLKFGDMDIFHRYEQPSGRGPLLFRMANMYNPGTFDLDDIDSFRTRGVVLFMALPIKYDGHKAFTMMYNAANKIADAMPRAAVLDHNRNPMTKQSVQHTYQRIREFERKARLAGLRSSQ
ncbi:cell division protein ZipA [Aliidiomarina sanyensis]|uniref:Cell division protein ZipA n=1 Tax=Aliidiomarina sanyensis TaxID=1249555 RepID=A0A432WNA8_9GAMM|nr:cell division protein ZipA [Aliidiomarina sanyensis]RUO35264.1 cell division protein ZipA [Aliidiomarina sanyensis]